MLYPYRDYAQAYIDDITIYSKSLDKHIDDLIRVYNVLNSKRVSLSLVKTFISFLSITLLSQRINALGLTTYEQKIATVTRLSFPKSLSDLKHFLSLIGYLRYTIPFYLDVVEPLEARKTAMLKSRPKKVLGNANTQKSFIKISYITEPSIEELESFYQLKGSFAQPTTLYYANPKRPYYLDINASKQRGFSAIYYSDLPPIIKDSKS